MAKAVEPAPTGARWRLGFAGAGVLLGAADTYVVVIALPAIMSSVGVDLAHLQQATPIISGFLVGYVAVLPLLGRLSDLYGRAPVLLRLPAALRRRVAAHRVGDDASPPWCWAARSRGPAAAAWCR